VVGYDHIPLVMHQSRPHGGLSSHRFIRYFKASLAQREEQQGDVALGIFNDQHAQRLVYFPFRFDNCLHSVAPQYCNTAQGSGRRHGECALFKTLEDNDLRCSSLLLT
jgi:hypothetical protein